MTTRRLTDEMERWVIAQATSGVAPHAVLQPLLDEGWSEQDAVDAVAAAVNGYVALSGHTQGLPPPSPVPVPVEPNGAWILDGGDREVRVLASMRLPRVVAFGGLLADEECDAMIELARPRLERSMTVEPDSGGDMVHPDRTSFGLGFARGEHPYAHVSKPASHACWTGHWTMAKACRCSTTARVRSTSHTTIISTRRSRARPCNCVAAASGWPRW